MQRQMQRAARLATCKRFCFTGRTKRSQLHDGWVEENGALMRTVEFPTKDALWAFLSNVSEKAEGMQHHPEWRYTESAVNIKLTTHDAGNTVTVKDIDMALYMDEVSATSVETLPVGAVTDSVMHFRKQCDDFVQAFELMKAVRDCAQTVNHEPSVFNVYNNVHVTLPSPLSGKAREVANKLTALGFLHD